MPRRNDVFFFTFIDLLLQVIFIGLLLFAAQFQLRSKVDAQREKLIRTPEDADHLTELLRRTGVSNIVELNDKLTRMMPADQCIPLKECKADHEFLAKSGGRETVREKLAELEKGTGPTPCETELDGSGQPALDDAGRPVPLSIATLRVFDDSVEFEEGQPSAALSKVLEDLGLEYARIRRLRLKEFIRVFGGKKAEGQGRCRHFVTMRAVTELRAPVDKVRGVFPQKGRFLAR